MLGLLLAVACGNDGVVPPPGQINFPIAVEMSTDGQFLFVANSNFDLRYNQGSVQTIDLDVFNQAIEDGMCEGRAAESCAFIDSASPGDTTNETGAMALPGLIPGEVLLGSYADGMTLGLRGDGSPRLYLPIRSESNLSFIDVGTDGTLSCGGERSCSPEFRTAATIEELELILPSDPVAVLSGSLMDLGSSLEGRYVMLAHRGGEVSLFVETDGRPVLVDVLEGLPTNLISMGLNATDQLVWITSGGGGQVSRVGVAVDNAVGTIEDLTLYAAPALQVSGIDTGGTSDTRDIQFDPRPSVERAYVLSRRPEALAITRLDDDRGALDVEALVEVCGGPSRLTLATFPLTIRERTFAFVSCFDSSAVYVIDVDLRQLVGVSRGLSGPFELEVDVTRQRFYAIDFRSSVVRVVDLRPVLECLSNENPSEDRECSPELLGLIGRVRPVVELQ